MKVLLLAAGRSKRLKPIEDKNLLSFLGKPLIAHQIEQIRSCGLKKIIIIAGIHNLAAIKKLAAGIDKAIKVVEQKDLEAGMAGAIMATEKLIKGDSVFVVSANDVVDKEAYKLVLQAAKDESYDNCLIGKRVGEYFPGGYLKIRGNGMISGIVEKPGAGREPSKMINLVLHFHRDGARLVEAIKSVKSKRDDWYEVALDEMIKGGARIKAVPYNGFWQPIKYPWHIFAMMNRFFGELKGIKKGKHVEIAKSATIKGNVVLEDGVKVMENAVISGPAYIGKNTIIATNALVRESEIGENCVIGFGSEVARSHVGSDVWTHTNYIGDSIIGNNCSFGSGTVTGNLRLDEGNIPVNIEGEKIDSGSSKLGLITGDNVRCGINTSFMPGIKIGNNSFVGAGIVVAQDIEDDKFVYGRTELILKDNIAKADKKKREEMRNKVKGHK
jgi:UDP-N-acetylglucosamine diphosphorylase / glucose-1-phosphate thymidylyltransferase / UDP-N-acetylgalactosamine diphosphorylase / glucosamine-1-phosphate N-acetyltransferase / galactosamine-1-phosphate N-acetyltransferase